MFLDRVVHFGEKLGEEVKGRSPKKIVDSGSICSVPDSTGSKLEYDPHLFSVACSQTELSISVKIWEIR